MSQPATRQALRLDRDEVTAFSPVIVFDEAIFLKPFGTGPVEGAISRRLVAEPGTYEAEPSLPLLATMALDARKGQLTVTITNATQSESASDGSCLPALVMRGKRIPSKARRTQGSSATALRACMASVTTT